MAAASVVGGELIVTSPVLGQPADESRTISPSAAEGRDLLQILLYREPHTVHDLAAPADAAAPAIISIAWHRPRQAGRPPPNADPRRRLAPSPHRALPPPGAAPGGMGVLRRACRPCRAGPCSVAGRSAPRDAQHPGTSEHRVRSLAAGNLAAAPAGANTPVLQQAPSRTSRAVPVASHIPAHRRDNASNIHSARLRGRPAHRRPHRRPRSPATAQAQEQSSVRKREGTCTSTGTVAGACRCRCRCCGQCWAAARGPRPSARLR